MKSNIAPPLFITILCLVLAICHGNLSYAEEEPTQIQQFTITHTPTAQIAVVDMQHISEKLEAAIWLRKYIDQLSKSIQADLSLQEIELKQAEEDLIALKGKIKDNEFQQNAKQFNRKVAEAQKSAQFKKVALDQKHSQGLSLINQEISNAVATISEKKGFIIALPASQIIFYQPFVDITEEVIEQMNQDFVIEKFKAQLDSHAAEN